MKASRLKLTVMLKQYTCAIFVSDHRQRPEQIASGVFLQHKGQYYLLSAGHSVKEWAIEEKKELFINDARHIIKLNGPMVVTQDDDIDIAVIQINHLVNDLSGIKFVTQELTSCGRTFSGSPLYFLHGHPVSKNKR